MQCFTYLVTCRPMDGLSGEQVDNESSYNTPWYPVSVQSLSVHHHCSEYLYCIHTSPWNGLNKYLPHHHTNAITIALLLLYNTCLCGYTLCLRST